MFIPPDWRAHSVQAATRELSRGSRQEPLSLPPHPRPAAAVGRNAGHLPTLSAKVQTRLPQPPTHPVLTTFASYPKRRCVYAAQRSV